MYFSFVRMLSTVDVYQTVFPRGVGTPIFISRFVMALSVLPSMKSL